MYRMVKVGTNQLIRLALVLLLGRQNAVYVNESNEELSLSFRRRRSLQVATVECCDIIVIFAVIQFSWYNADAFKSDKNVINLQRNCWNQFVGTFSLR